ncbi:MAG: MBL fold metallo-hydrolase [Candidatus Thorarchaeota archaeon]|nr:MBL fold metallo-hydrolase [Candidatus Thorarchaeota archaeon]
MRVTLLGTGTSYPDPDRVQSGVLVEAAGLPLLFDIGSGILQRLTQLDLPLTSIEHIFLSHFHIDHCSDFLTFYQSIWLSGFDKTLHLYGPPMIRDWLRGLFDVAFPYLRHKLKMEVTILEENHVVHIGPVTVITCPTLHGSMESRAFRIEHDGSSVVYTSDTAPCPEVIDLACGTDLLIHECNWLDGDHPSGVHTSPLQLADVVERIAPKVVILTHVPPEVVESAEQVLSIVQRRTDAKTLMGTDLTTFDV